MRHEGGGRAETERSGDTWLITSQFGQQQTHSIYKNGSLKAAALYKRFELLRPIQDSLEFHPASLFTE